MQDMLPLKRIVLLKHSPAAPGDAPPDRHVERTAPDSPSCPAADKIVLAENCFGQENEWHAELIGVAPALDFARA